MTLPTHFETIMVTHQLEVYSNGDGCWERFARALSEEAAVRYCQEILDARPDIKVRIAKVTVKTEILAWPPNTKDQNIAIREEWDRKFTEKEPQ